MAQDKSGPEQEIILNNINVQIDATVALNDLYNFKFAEAEKQFRWIKQKYAWHPLPYFLLGLSEWWKIMPNTRTKAYDKKFLAYMDSTILIAKNLYNKREDFKIEAAFFLSAAYGFKGRLYSDEERKEWRKAASAGKKALKYLEISKKQNDLSVELLFGDALYNYFSKWIPENYPALKPVLMFFPKGNKKLGLEQLRQVANNAFYTRTEAQVWLMRILNSYENDRKGALQIGEYLFKTYPRNAYFHRYYARLLYSNGQYTRMKPVSEKILAKIDSGVFGYEATSGRYASFYLGQYYQSRAKYDQSKIYYNKTVAFGEEVEAEETGYYLYACLYLARLYAQDEDYIKAEGYVEKIKDNSKKKHPAHKGIKNLEKTIKTEKKKAKKLSRKNK